MTTRSYTEYPAPRRRPRKRSSRVAPLLALLALALCAGGGLVAVAIWWPSARIAVDSKALVSLELAPVGEHVASVSVVDGRGRHVAVSLRSGEVWPSGKLAAGERLKIRATVRRAWWASWLVGGSEQVEATVVTPRTRVRSTLLHLAPNAPVAVRFDAPASRVTLKLPGFKQDHLTLGKPRAVVQTGLRATGAHRFGTLVVAVAARSWETMSKPVRVSWFPAGKMLQAVVRPAPGAVIEASTPIKLTFSEPVSVVLGKTRPALDPPTPGKWTVSAGNTLTFKPSGSGFALGRPVVLTLPAPTAVLAPGGTKTKKSLSWRVPVGSIMRLEQLLSTLGYLPLDWKPANAPVPATTLAQQQAALHPPEGSFSWRYPDTPRQLKALWKPGGWTRMTQGAVMAFQSDHGLTVDGIPGPIMWRTLIAAAIHGEHAQFYSYVLVHRNVPQNLTLWSDGKTILKARINTGVPAAPTPLGTHAVFEHIRVGTMRGRNPDGSRYVDHGIPWISYFYGGEAIHGFDRATYGYPQSVGCVEAPVATAAKIWPYTPIGTLVTIVK